MLKKYTAEITIFDRQSGKRAEVLAPNEEHARGLIIQALEEDLELEPLDYVITSIVEVARCM